MKLQKNVRPNWDLNPGPFAFCASGLRTGLLLTFKWYSLYKQNPCYFTSCKMLAIYLQLGFLKIFSFVIYTLPISCNFLNGIYTYYFYSSGLIISYLIPKTYNMLTLSAKIQKLCKKRIQNYFVPLCCCIKKVQLLPHVS